MNLKLFIWLVAGLAVLVGGFFILNRDKEAPGGGGPQIEASLKPWIEVLKPRVFLVLPDGGKSELKSGDELLEGGELETDQTGFAAIHFPEGSVARLEPESRVVLEAGSFDKKTGVLKAGIFLKLGRVWSRVSGLASPESSWEVKTSNAVATVRGTAFGVEFSRGHTWVLVKENKVALKALEPETNKELAEVEIREAQAVRIKPEELPALAAGKAELKIESKPKDIFEAEWVERNAELDLKFDEKIEELRKESVLPEAEFREKLNQELLLEAKSEPVLKEESPPPKAQLPEPSTAPTILKGEPEALKVLALQKFTALTEGETASFSAYLVLSNGSRREVTKEVSWRVLGDIGAVAAGIFTAKLAPDVAELGEVKGQVIAIFKDTSSGKELLGVSEIFIVKAKIEAVRPEG